MEFKNGTKKLKLFCIRIRLWPIQLLDSHLHRCMVELLNLASDITTCYAFILKGQFAASLKPLMNGSSSSTLSKCLLLLSSNDMRHKYPSNNK